MKKDGDICLVRRSSPRCWACSSWGGAPAARALNAEVTLQGVQGTRRMAAAALYRDDGIEYTTERHEEVITAVHLPALRGRMTSAYWKLRRRPAFDFPILAVAVALGWDDGAVREARGALGAVGSHPVDITTFLSPLNGRRPTEDLIPEGAEAAAKPGAPLPNTPLTHHLRTPLTNS